MISSCNTFNSNKIIVVEENTRKFKINNNNGVFVNKVRVDGCYQTNGKKCDYLFEIMSPSCKSILSEIYYVELKGCKLDVALEQLISTINYCNSIHKDIPKNAVAVLSRTPRFSTGIQKMQVEILKLIKSVPIVKNQIVEVNI